MTHDSWDLAIDEGKPGFSQTGIQTGTWSTSYRRFGSGDGVRPLVLARSFHGAFPEYMELDEEFRLYHDLAEDKRRNLLLSFDTSGRRIEVIRMTENSVFARLKYLRQFQAGTGLHLAIYVDSVRYSSIRLRDVLRDEQRRTKFVSKSLRWRRTIGDCYFRKEFETFSRVVGKAILPPPPQENAGVWPFLKDRRKPDVKFIIGVDQNGNEIEYTSSPVRLNNYFAANPEAPLYLTPVYFRREVLAKYFSEPERYSVSDGRLKCLRLWSCQIDNDLKSYVVVFLGDLGRDLPYEERLHWRQFNVPADGGISETNLRRSILAQPAYPKSPDLVFVREYSDLIVRWQKTHGWPLFLPLSSGDKHILNTIRVPVTDSQSELDEQVGLLSKLLVDSLNERELQARADDLKRGARGIDKFAGFLKATQFPQDQYQSLIQFLRDLQTLRSTGSAHRKGSGYDKIAEKLEIQLLTKPDVARRLLEGAIVALRSLRLHYCGRKDDIAHDDRSE